MYYDFEVLHIWAHFSVYIYCLLIFIYLGFPGDTSSKESACQCRRCSRPGLIPGLGRFPGGGHGNPLPYSCLKDSMDRGAWWATVCGAAKSWTWLSTHLFIRWCLVLAIGSPGKSLNIQLWIVLQCPLRLQRHLVNHDLLTGRSFHILGGLGNWIPLFFLA